VTLVDTAGVQATFDLVEREGIGRTLEGLRAADAVILVLDASRPIGDADLDLLARTAQARRLVLINKIDELAAWGAEELPLGEAPVLSLSLKTGSGTAALRSALAAVLTGEQRGEHSEPPAITNVRHVALLEAVAESLARAGQAASDGLSEEFVLTDLQHARDNLEAITGRRPDESLLHHIFQRFCIGK